MKRKLLAFARLLKCFEEVTTDRGILVSDNDIVVGSEVFILKENGELTPADSGRYVTETMIYEVEGGFITKIEVVETQPEPEQLEEEIIEVEQPALSDPEIEQLKAKITELEAVIKEKDEEIARLKAELEQPTEEIIETQKKVEEYSTQRKTGLDALRAAIRK